MIPYIFTIESLFCGRIFQYFTVMSYIEHCSSQDDFKSYLFTRPVQGLKSEHYPKIENI